MSFSEKMAVEIVPKYINKVQGLVYLGAAVLIIVVGLRGLGEAASTVGFLPDFLFRDGRIKLDFVVGALFLEFTMLLLLSFFTYYTRDSKPESSTGNSTETPAKKEELLSAQIDFENLKKNLEELKNIAKDDAHHLDTYLQNMHQLNQKLAAVHKEYTAVMSDIKQGYKTDAAFKTMASEELKAVESYIDKVTQITHRISSIKKEYLTAVSDIKHTFRD